MRGCSPFGFPPQAEGTVRHLACNPEMSTTEPTAPRPVYFGTSLRVTTQAVELRDRSYGLDNVQSVQVTRVRSNGTMLVFLFMLAAFVLGLLFFSLKIAIDAGSKIVETSFGIAGLLIGLAFNLALISGLVIFYRTVMNGWHYIYVARLRRKRWHTDIAASFHTEPIDQVAVAVNQALSMIHNGGAPADLATLYYEEHSILVDDTLINVDGQVYPTNTVTYASMDTISAIPWYMLILNYIWTLVFIGIYRAVSRNLSSEMALILLFGIAIALMLMLLVATRVLQRTNKDKDYPTTGTYECKLHTADATMFGFVSVDKEYTRAAVDAVNAIARRQTASTRRPPSATRTSQRTT